jgi:hypothetical protein
MKRLSKADRGALERAIALTLAERDLMRVAQVREMLKTRPRDEVGHFCAYHRQCEVLRPKPWQPVPANSYVTVTDRDDEALGPVSGRAAAAELLRRLLAARLSRFEPDPLNALARVAAERAKSAPGKFSPSDSPTKSSPQRGLT